MLPQAQNTKSPVYQYDPLDLCWTTQHSGYIQRKGCVVLGGGGVGGGVVYRCTQTIIYSIKPLYQFYNPKTRKDLTHLGENNEGVPDLDEAA